MQNWKHSDNTDLCQDVSGLFSGPCSAAIWEITVNYCHPIENALQG